MHLSVIKLAQIPLHGATKLLGVRCIFEIALLKACVVQSHHMESGALNSCHVENALEISSWTSYCKPFFSTTPKTSVGKAINNSFSILPIITKRITNG